MSIHYLSGFADEAGPSLETQIRATQELAWSHIEMRNVAVEGFPSGNLHDISDEAFEAVAEQLGAAGVSVNCFGTAIAKNADGFDYDVRAAKNIARRAAKVGAKLARVMSYPQQSLPEDEVFRRLREITRILTDGGVQTVFENCSNYAGMGWQYAQKLVKNVPGTQIVFDPGNCISDLDYSKPAPHPHQNAWEFYENIRPHIAYFHVKDALWEGKKIHTFPGEGEADVKRILTDLLESGYDGAISIEPHMQAGLPDLTLSHEDNCYQTYVEYGRHLERLLADISAGVHS